MSRAITTNNDTVVYVFFQEMWRLEQPWESTQGKNLHMVNWIF